MSAILVKRLSSIKIKISNTKPLKIDIKPKDAIKLNIFKLDKSKAYPEENVLPEDYFFFYQDFLSRTPAGDSNWREGTIFYSTLPFPPAHEHSDTYLKLCMSDD